MTRKRLYAFNEEVAVPPNREILLEMFRREKSDGIGIFIDAADHFDPSQYITRGELSFPPRLIAHVDMGVTIKEEIIGGLYRLIK